jgi:hypothetical protein
MQQSFLAGGYSMLTTAAANVQSNGKSFTGVHHDFPQRALADQTVKAPRPPLPASFFRDQGRSPAFVEYLEGSLGFVATH